MSFIQQIYKFLIEGAAVLGARTRISEFALRRQINTNPQFIRALNYHDIPQEHVKNFEKHLQYFSKHFVNVDLDTLKDFGSGKWPHDKPGLIISFDDGLKSHYDFAKPLLEKYNFTGWFMLPYNFLDTPDHEQTTFARKNSIQYSDIPAGKRCAMSWEEVGQLKDKHIVGSHTMNHCRLGDQTKTTDFEYEIIFSKKALSKKLGQEVDVFCWVGGEEWSYSSHAAAAIRKAKYSVSLLTNSNRFVPDDHLQEIQRTNCEANFNLNKVKLCLSGFFDLRYYRRRKRVEEVIRD